MKTLSRKTIVLWVVMTLLVGCQGNSRKEPVNKSGVENEVSNYQARDEQWEMKRARLLRIKSQVQTKYRFEFGKPSQKGITSVITRFDTLGRIVETIPHDAYGDPDYIDRFYYDKLDHIVLRKTFYPARERQFGDDPPHRQPEIERSKHPHFDRYDSAGDLLERPIYVGDMMFGKVMYNYDSLGNRISEVTYNASGRFDHRVVFEHDELGRIVASRGQYAPGSTYGYDEHDNVIERIDSNRLGDPIFLVRYSYTYFK